MEERTKEFPSFSGGGNHPRYAVILAGGDGSRLQALTRAVSGDDRPKQFCPLIGGRTLLDSTRDRVRLLIEPENTFFSLTAKHERFFRSVLWDVPQTRRIIQPENKGTAPAILYSLMRISAINPQATVAFFASDHFIADDAAFMDHVGSAFHAAVLNPDSVVMLGIEPDKAETSYGWIEPANSLFGSEVRSFSRVERFWEKPTAKVARRLLDKGCLWNSFVMVGRVDALLAMFREHVPKLFRMFNVPRQFFGKEAEKAIVRSIYSWIGETNFSSEVLENATEKLMVMRVADSGWSDLGEPQRVIGTLSALGLEPAWTASIAA